MLISCTKYFTKETLLGRLEVVENELRQSRELSRIETNFNTLNIQLNLSRSTSARGYFASISRSDEDRKIEEGVALLVRKENDGKKIFKYWICNEFGHYASKCPKREKRYKGKFKPRRDRDCLYANEEDDSDDQVVSASDDEIGCVAIKEESPKKMALVSKVENKSNWIIDGGCLHHMTGDITKFVDFKSHDGGIVRVGNNAMCHVKGIGSITLDCKNDTKDVYFCDGLKHNILSVGQLVDKGYQLQFTEKTCVIKDKDGKVIGT